MLSYFHIGYFVTQNFYTNITNIRCQGTWCFTFIFSIQSIILWGIYYLLLIGRQSFNTIKGYFWLSLSLPFLFLLLTFPIFCPILVPPTSLSLLSFAPFSPVLLLPTPFFLTYSVFFVLPLPILPLGVFASFSCIVITWRVCSKTSGWPVSWMSDWVGLGRGLVICISNSFPGDAIGSIQWEPLL